MTKAVWVSGAVEWRGGGEGGETARRPPPLVLEGSRSGPWFCGPAASVQLLGAASWLALLWSERTKPSALVSVAFAAAGAITLGVALTLHGSRDHDRRTKYNALLGGQALLSWALLFALYPSRDQVALVVGISATALLLLLPQAWAIHRLLQADLPASADVASFRRAVTLYRLTRRAGPGIGWRSACAFALSRVIDPTGYCFLLTRYFATEKLKLSKVLYLCAFHEPQSEALTTQAILPLTARLPIEAWVEARPGELSIQRHAAAGLGVRAIRVDDADWQLWLEHQLRAALAVVVDASREGARLSYELKLALQLVPRERIVLLLPEGTREPRSGLGSITFEASRPREAEAPLATWLERIVAKAQAKPS